MCISLLLPERLQDQFCFRTEKAVSTLEYLKSEKVALEQFMENKPSDKTLLAMDLTAMMAVEQLSKETKQPQEKILLDFMESNTAKMLYDDSTKLWWDGPSVAAEDFKNQNNQEKLMQFTEGSLELSITETLKNEKIIVQTLLDANFLK